MTVVDDPVELGDPDLDVVFADAIVIGSDVLWFADIQNTGDAYSGGFYVDAILDSPSAPGPGSPFDATTYVSGLAPGAVTEVYLELYDVDPGSYDSWIAVDLDELVSEANEGNNTDGPLVLNVAAPALGPDLVNVEAFALTDTVGLITEYAVEITNQGDVATQDFWLDLYTDQRADPCSGRVLRVVPGRQRCSGTWHDVVELGVRRQL